MQTLPYLALQRTSEGSYGDAYGISGAPLACWLEESETHTHTQTLEVMPNGRNLQNTMDFQAKMLKNQMKQKNKMHIKRYRLNI